MRQKLGKKDGMSKYIKLQERYEYEGEMHTRTVEISELKIDAAKLLYAAIKNGSIPFDDKGNVDLAMIKYFRAVLGIDLSQSRLLYFQVLKGSLDG
jgi:hypothetical protein